MSLVLRIPWSSPLAPFIHQIPSHSQDFVSNVHRRRSRLVEQTEAHVVVRLLLLLLLGGSGGGLLSGTTSGSTTSGGGGATSTTRGNGGELLRAGRDQLRGVLVSCRKHVWSCANFAISIYAYLVDVLALELLEEGGEALLVGVNANGAENLLDVLSGRRGVAGQAEEEESCQVLHFESLSQSVSTLGGASVASRWALTVGWFGMNGRINHF